MSSRSSISVIWSESVTAARSSFEPLRAASIRIPASVTRRAKRSGRIGVSRLLSRRFSRIGDGRGLRARCPPGDLGTRRVPLDDQVEPGARLVDQLRRAEDAHPVA